MADFNWKTRTEIDNKVTPGVTANWGDDSNDILEDIVNKALAKDAASQTVGANLVLNGDITGTGVTTTGASDSLVKTNSDGTITLPTIEDSITVGSDTSTGSNSVNTSNRNAFTVKDGANEVFNVDTVYGVSEINNIPFSFISRALTSGEWYEIYEFSDLPSGNNEDVYLTIRTQGDAGTSGGTDIINALIVFRSGSFQIAKAKRVFGASLDFEMYRASRKIYIKATASFNKIGIEITQGRGGINFNNVTAPTSPTQITIS